MTDLLQLDAAAAPPGRLSAWLADRLRDAVADGRLPPGSRLPPSRVLAAELGVSRGAVVQAYQRLVDEGRAVGRSGAGTTIVSAPPPEPAPRAAPGPPPVELDLSPGLPDLSAFPRAAWLRAERAALATATPADLGYGDPRGTPALRTALAEWLRRTRGVRAAADDVLVVGGVAQGLSLLAQVLPAHGVDALAVEDPGSRGTREQVARRGLATPPVPVDADGLDVAALRRTGAPAVLVTPAHQFPTGVVLAPSRRRALLDWAGLVVEDDYDAEHRYDRAPVAALQGQAPDRVVHAGSVSKTLAPALRLGWLVAPAPLRDGLAQAKRFTDLQSPALPQLVLAELLRGGGFDRHLRAVRTRQRARRDAVLDELARRLPAARVHGVAAGLHLLVTLPDGVDDAELAARARDAGVAVQPLSRHRQRPGPPGLVLGYAATPPDRLRVAVARLAALL